MDMDENRLSRIDRTVPRAKSLKEAVSAAIAIEKLPGEPHPRAKAIVAIARRLLSEQLHRKNNAGRMSKDEDLDITAVIFGASAEFEHKLDHGDYGSSLSDEEALGAYEELIALHKSLLGNS